MIRVADFLASLRKQFEREEKRRLAVQTRLEQQQIKAKAQHKLELEDIGECSRISGFLYG